MKEVTVEVTEFCITTGQRGVCSRCPLAVAFCLLFPNSRVTIGLSTGGIYTSSGVDYSVTLPAFVGDWIKEYDKGGFMKPFSFTAVLTPNT